MYNDVHSSGVHNALETTATGRLADRPELPLASASGVEATMSEIELLSTLDWYYFNSTKQMAVVRQIDSAITFAYAFPHWTVEVSAIAGRGLMLEGQLLISPAIVNRGA